jgi:DNA-binding transcriptional LysR family regulator
MGAVVRCDERIGRRLKLRDLHIFMTVVQQGSMGKAAKQLAVSQPVVSKAISDLESTLKVRLVDRTAKGIEPTAYGDALLRGGATVFDDLGRSVKEIEFLADPTGGEVRIASVEVLNAIFVPTVIDRLSRKLPRLVFHVLSVPAPTQQFEALHQRSVDLAVSYLAVPFEHEDLHAEFLYSDSLSVVASPDSKWARRRRIELSELLDEYWVLPTKDTLGASAVGRAFLERGLALPRNFVTTNSTQLRQALIATGRVLSFVSTTRLRLTGKRWPLKAVPVDLRIPYGSVGIITLKNRTINPAAERFIECAREVATSPLMRKPREIPMRTSFIGFAAIGGALGTSTLSKSKRSSADRAIGPTWSNLLSLRGMMPASG